MTLRNNRRQHAVGQGFFHSGALMEGGELRLRYVYDCGAMQKYAAERDARIDDYLARVGARSPLHILYISHVHADHLNGVSRLLDAKTGLKVDTIVLPLINVADRLIGFARTATEDAGSAADAFYRDFIINPAAALSRFNPRQILFIEAGPRDGGAPGSDGAPADDFPRRDLIGKGAPETRPAWELVGQGSIRWEDGPAGTAAPVRTMVIPDTMAMMTAANQSEWLLAPFVDPTVSSHTSKFLNALAKRRKMSRAKLAAWLRITANVQILVTTDLGDLVGAYSDIAKDLNVASLCLYSGPAPSAQSLPRRAFAQFGGVTLRSGERDHQPIAWLATGDAALKEKARRTDFLNHYGALLENVLTLTLPHHGSDHNFDPELLDRVRPNLCLAAADRFSKWKHPGPHAIQSVASRGLFLQVVTSQTPSTAWESVQVG